MPPHRRIDPEQGRRALLSWQNESAVDRSVIALAVRWSLEELAVGAPGATTEVRVPPFGVVQCVAGPRHTRGTPPNVVETDGNTWLGLVSGRMTWEQALSGGRLRVSGERADLSALLPLSDGNFVGPDGG